MSHPLVHEIRAVARRAKRLLVLYGAAAVVATGAACAAAAGLVDYTLRIRDPGVRLLLSLAVLSALAAAVWRFLIPALRRRWTDVEIAWRLEQRFPHLRDRLSSAVEFVQQAEQDAAAGSAELRRALVAQTMADVQQLRLGEALDPRRPRRMALLAAAAMGIVILLACASPSVARVAAKRILVPWGDDQWPRATIWSSKTLRGSWPSVRTWCFRLWIDTVRCPRTSGFTIGWRARMKTWSGRTRCKLAVTVWSTGWPMSRVTYAIAPRVETTIPCPGTACRSSSRRASDNWKSSCSRRHTPAGPRFPPPAICASCRARRQWSSAWPLGRCPGREWKSPAGSGWSSCRRRWTVPGAVCACPPIARIPG